MGLTVATDLEGVDLLYFTRVLVFNGPMENAGKITITQGYSFIQFNIGFSFVNWNIAGMA